jgi:choline kinase
MNVPHACNTKLYPNVEEQKRFIRSYLTHRPSFSANTPAANDYPSGPGTPYLPETPSLQPVSSSLSTSLISNFMLDSRFPQSRDVERADEEREAQVDMEVGRLMRETRIWRLANSAMWVMWGVLQGKIPSLPDFEDPTQQAAIAAGPSQTSLPGLSEHATKDVEIEAGTDALGEEEEGMAEDLKDKRPVPEEGEDDEEFDYLGYAFDRAMFFWGDAVGWGIVKEEDLPEDVRKNIKLVEY